MSKQKELRFINREIVLTEQEIRKKQEYILKLREIRKDVIKIKVK